MKDIHFVLSSDLNVPLKLKILNLEGKIELPNVEEDPELRHTTFFNSLCKDFHVTSCIYSDGKPLTVPVRTCYSNHEFVWNEWLSFPIKYNDLPLDSQIAITVWAVAGPRKKIPIAGTAFSLFSNERSLRKGKQRLQLSPNVEGNGMPNTTTPGKIKNGSKMDTLDRLVKQYERGTIPKIEWLDQLAFTRIDREAQIQREKSDSLEMFVELPNFEFKIIFHEKEKSIAVPSKPAEKPPLLTIRDPDLEMKDNNPVANKHLKLVFSNWRKIVDPDLRPSPPERDRIEVILSYPITKHLSLEEKDILWKFRFYLTSNPRALTKFLRCVDWTNNQEAKQATELINQWKPIEISDALELLSKSFTSHTVRDYAVSRLEQASNAELLNYLLQLVQALRYDSAKHESKLTKFLISRSVTDNNLRNALYWYLRVECDNPKYQSFYQRKLIQFKNILSKEEDGRKMLQIFQLQEDLIAQLTSLYKELRAMKLSRPKKVQKVIELMSPAGTFAQLGYLNAPVPLPVNSAVEVVGMIPDKLKIFSSSLEPLKITWRLKDGKDYSVLFKSGDDLRQDQVIIQLISLMDQLLKKENLDLKLTPYRVLSSSSKDGMVEFVKSYNLATVLEKYGPDNQIHNFFREYHPDPGAPYQIDPEVINTFVRSCAGYCVITYLLCVGDRHLDNLLITTEGRLFHIDFGFIGRDPKPYPPPMKLCTEMIAGMGGEESKDFTLFKQLCVEAYNNLRKNANLILNLISLMADSNITDIATERCLYQVQERFQMEMTDEQAGQAFQKLMTESVSALFPRISEKIHKWKQYWENTKN